MKKLLTLLLCAVMLISVIPCASAIGNDGATAENEISHADKFACQTLPIADMKAFEGSHAGYSPALSEKDGKSVRTLERTGEDNTNFKFNYYRWDALRDENGDYISLDTANYVIIDYYYESPDENPALVGNRMQWMQGRIAPADSPASIIEFAWSTNLFSNGMVANKWDKLVIPLGANETVKVLKARYAPSVLHQMKLFPLERDMGKNDKLYIGDIVFQSWDPSGGSGISERTIYFYGSADDLGKTEKAIKTVKAKDLDVITIPEFDKTYAPENAKFIGWLNTWTEKTYKEGTEMSLASGCDIEFVPVFSYSFDFSSNTAPYINGYEDGTFGPQKNITRAEACKILAAIISPEIKGGRKSKFTDIKEADWYYNYITTLEGYGALDLWENVLEPSKLITRGEFVQIVYAVSDKNITSMKLKYVPDVPADNKYFDAVMFATATGIIAGYEDGSFKADANITRAETVTIVNRMLGRVPTGKDISKFSDIASHWAKDQIIASSTSLSDGAFTVSEAGAKKKYVLSGSNTEEYLDSLYEQAKTLDSEAIRAGIDVVSDKIKESVLSTGNTEIWYKDRMTGKTYYISELHGDDANSGTSPESAVKTIAGVESKLRFPGKGTTLLFERGGIYRGQVTAFAGVTIGSYGEGEKPVLTGSLKDYADPSLWKETDAKNVYQLTDKISNVGIIAFDHDMHAHGNYDGIYGKNRIYPDNISSYTGLTKDLEFYSCDETLYLCSTSGNPGSRFKSIEIGSRADVIEGGGTDIVIDNLSIKHTGAHGIGFGSSKNITVTNCEFSWLGGSLLGIYGKTTTQYGNAVEIFGSCDGYYVKNNWMYQIYDTAVTHQYSETGKEDCTMNDIEYCGNLMEYVHWAVEFYIAESQNNKRSMTNYISHHNILRNGGYGWGSIVTKRQDSARLYSCSSLFAKNENLRCEHNVLDRCSGYLLDIHKNSKETFDSNIYIQDEGHLLGTLKKTSRICGKTSAADIHEYLGDDNAIVICIPE